MKREGPGFLQKLLGQIAYPPSSARCSSCGALGADSQASAILTSNGQTTAALLSSLCPACRTQHLKKSLSREK